MVVQAVFIAIKEMLRVPGPCTFSFIHYSILEVTWEMKKDSYMNSYTFVCLLFNGHGFTFVLLLKMNF